MTNKCKSDSCMAGQWLTPPVILPIMLIIGLALWVMLRPNFG